jgi:hypothetical protein
MNQKTWKTEFKYLYYKLENTSYISIGADNDHNVDILDSHIKERTTDLLHRTSTKFFHLHYIRPKCINHIYFPCKATT